MEVAAVATLIPATLHTLVLRSASVVSDIRHSLASVQFLKQRSLKSVSSHFSCVSKLAQDRLLLLYWSCKTIEGDAHVQLPSVQHLAAE